jgi:DNA-binding GntR family transcriptional regulator
MLFAAGATPEDRADLQRLAARVDSLAASDHSLYLPAHEKLHRGIAEGARCPALSIAIEKTHALASTWFCIGRKNPDQPAIRRHQDLVEVLVSGTPQEAADTMRAHVACGMENTMSRLKPYFRIRKAFGRTYFRSEKRQKQQLVDPSAWN